MDILSPKQNGGHHIWIPCVKVVNLRHEYHKTQLDLLDGAKYTTRDINDKCYQVFSDSEFLCVQKG